MNITREQMIASLGDKQLSFLKALGKQGIRIRLIKNNRGDVYVKRKDKST